MHQPKSSQQQQNFNMNIIDCSEKFDFERE